MTETGRPGAGGGVGGDPFAVPENRRHLRHAFYLRHPELDQRTAHEMLLDRSAYDDADPSERAERPPSGHPGYPDRARPDARPSDLADAVRDFLAGGATLDELAEALGEAEGRG